jgi:sugar phosphate isomerase/epimerase
MIDLLHSLNIHHIQLSPQQAQKLDADGTAALINKLKSVKMDIVSMGPIEFGPSEADARPSFELARKLKMKTIVAYADDSSLEMLDKLANEYHVNVAIRNQPKPAGHWDPDDLLKALDGRSNRVGACADVAAWRASGSVPAQCVKKLAGHVLEIHLTSFDDSDSALALGELHKQKFKGICAIECKPGTNAVQQFAHNVTEFSKIVRELSGAQ